MSIVNRITHWAFRRLLGYKICPACGDKLDPSMSDKERQSRWMRYRS